MALREYQKEAADAAVACFQRGMWNGLLVMPTACHAKGTKILMYDGTMKRVEDICIGDRLMGVNSTPRTVLELHHGIDDMYEIQPKIGDVFVVNKNHILSLYKTKEGDYPCQLSRIDNISVGDYLLSNKWYKHIHKLHKPSVVDFGKVDGSVGEPYLLGLYLGDGSSVDGNFNITTMRVEVEDYLRKFCQKCGYNLRVSKKPGNKAKTLYVSNNGTKSKPNPVLEWLKDIGVYKLTAGDKHIPHNYKIASVKDRYQLLAGLLDTDAWYAVDRCMFEYCTKSYRLAKDIQFLCRSLGFMCNIGKPKVVKGINYYRLQISGNLEKIPTKVAIRQAKPRKMKKSVLVTGFDVKLIGSGEYYGFTLDGDHLYMDEQFFIHHNCGKSHVISDIASRIDAPLLVFAPSREITLQNYDKILRTGMTDVGIYSASLGMKNIRRITLATIGSVHNHMDDFRLFKFVIVDEAHRADAESGMYKDYLTDREDRCVIGLTATPFRMSSFMGYAKLTFLTRTKPRIYDRVLYVCQVSDMMEKGYLCKPQYFDISGRIAFRLSNVKLNMTGMDYDEKSLEGEYKRSNFARDLLTWTLMSLRPNDGTERNGVLVFTRFVREAELLMKGLRNNGISSDIVSAKTPKEERRRIVEDFRSGKIKVLTNASAMLEGFDYPALDTVIIANPTRSLTRWCQMVGRCVRPYDGKKSWVLDMSGCYRHFGKMEDMRIENVSGAHQWEVTTNGRKLTGIIN